MSTGTDKQKFIIKQLRETMEGITPEVTCGCGLKMPLRYAFKCLYCHEFYCEACAEIHFGKTRSQYYTDKETLNVS